MTNRIYIPANRSNIDSFYVMELLYNANKLEANGKKIFHLELGEPIPKTPKAVLKEASRLSRLSLPLAARPRTLAPSCVHLPCSPFWVILCFVLVDSMFCFG